MKRLMTLMAAAFFVLALSACGGGGGGGDNSSPSGDTPSVTVASITIEGGNNQTATVGSELPKSLVAVLKNSQGQVISGQTINFVVVSGGGSVFAGAATSDSNGIVRERWTLGTIAGNQRVEVRAVDSSGNGVVFATFDAIATSGSPQTVSIVEGNNQSAYQNQTLQSLIWVAVVDAYGNPCTGIPVAFTANNGGSVIQGSTSTNVDGEASATWTLGETIGTQTLTTTVSGVQTVTLVATSLIAPGLPDNFSILSGNSQTGIPNEALPLPITVILKDNYGNPVSGVIVNFTANNGGIASPESVTTNLQGEASTSWTLGQESGTQTLDATANGLPSLSFGATTLNSAPTAILVVPDVVYAGEEFVVDSSNSTDPDNNIVYRNIRLSFWTNLMGQGSDPDYSVSPTWHDVVTNGSAWSTSAEKINATLEETGKYRFDLYVEDANMLGDQDVAEVIVVSPLVDNNDGTISDTFTGLMWQKEDDGNKYYYAEAVGRADDGITFYNPQGLNICGDLTLAGHSNWRVPNQFELKSLVDMRENGAKISSVFFPQAKTDQYMTNQFVPNTRHVTVDFIDGMAMFGGTAYVRCVR